MVWLSGSMLYFHDMELCRYILEQDMNNPWAQKPGAIADEYSPADGSCWNLLEGARAILRRRYFVRYKTTGPSIVQPELRSIQVLSSTNLSFLFSWYLSRLTFSSYQPRPLKLSSKKPWSLHNEDNDASPNRYYVSSRALCPCTAYEVSHSPWFCIV